MSIDRSDVEARSLARGPPAMPRHVGHARDYSEAADFNVYYSFEFCKLLNPNRVIAHSSPVKRREGERRHSLSPHLPNVAAPTLTRLTLQRSFAPSRSRPPFSRPEAKGARAGCFTSSLIAPPSCLPPSLSLPPSSFFLSPSPEAANLRRHRRHGRRTDGRGRAEERKNENRMMIEADK